MRTRIGSVSAVALVVLVTAGCAAGATVQPSASPSVSPSTTPSITQTPTAPATPQLLVLADGIQGGKGLWSLDSAGKWSVVASAPNATALGRTNDGIAIASTHQLDVRAASNLSGAGHLTTLKWSAAAPAAPVVSLDGSPAGKLAIATADEHTLAYGLAAADGTVTTMSPAPTQSFTPLVAWLDETRLLVLTMDNRQDSRLALVKLGSQAVATSSSVLGATVFAVSGDRQSVAVATENAVYAGSVATFLSGSQPEQVATLTGAQVVWAISLNSAGTEVFMLSGTAAADGTLTSFHELEYSRQGSSWTKVMDSPAPFATAVSQVCLT